MVAVPSLCQRPCTRSWGCAEVDVYVPAQIYAAETRPRLGCSLIVRKYVVSQPRSAQHGMRMRPKLFHSGPVSAKVGQCLLELAQHFDFVPTHPQVGRNQAQVEPKASEIVVNLIASGATFAKLRPPLAKDRVNCSNSVNTISYPTKPARIRPNIGGDIDRTWIACGVDAARVPMLRAGLFPSDNEITKRRCTPTEERDENRETER